MKKLIWRLLSYEIFLFIVFFWNQCGLVPFHQYFVTNRDYSMCCMYVLCTGSNNIIFCVHISRSSTPMYWGQAGQTKAEWSLKPLAQCMTLDMTQWPHTMGIRRLGDLNSMSHNKPRTDGHRHTVSPQIEQLSWGLDWGDSFHLSSGIFHILT